MSDTKKETVHDSGEEVEEIDEETSRLSESDPKKGITFPTDRLLSAVALPKAVKRRVKALRALQLKYYNLEAKFYEEVHELECKYSQLYNPLFTLRENIVSGTYEPNDEECELPEEIQDKFNDLCLEFSKEVTVGETKPDDQNTEEEPVNGIPGFWLTIFKNVGLLSDMIHPHDEPILKHLVDVKVILLKESPMGFLIEFHFSPNEYFSTPVLTKEYTMKFEPEPNDPFSFEGPEIYRCKGCVIDWYKGKNVTVKVIRKKQKHKSKGSVRTITKTVPNDSFFNFFNPPYLTEEQANEPDEDTTALLTSDFEIGHYIRERIIPKAVLYYTGEALEEEEYDEECLEEEEDDSSDDNEGANEGGRGGNTAGNRELKQMNDCKQQ